MELTKLRMAELYQGYGSTDLIEIQELLIKCPPMSLTHKGVATMYGYHTYDQATMKRLIDTPREIGINMDDKATVDQLKLNVSEWKQIYILNKSMSHMVLKVDAGEVYDAMSVEEKKEARGFVINTESAVLVDETGEFTVIVTLLK